MTRAAVGGGMEAGGRGGAGTVGGERVAGGGGAARAAGRRKCGTKGRQHELRKAVLPRAVAKANRVSAAETKKGREEAESR